MSDIYLSLAETPAVVTLSQPVVSGVLSSTVTVGNTVTVALDANSLSALENVTVTVGAAVSVSNFPASQVVTGSVAVTTMPAISISSVSISNFPSTQTIAGTVTANLSNTVTATWRGAIGSFNAVPIVFAQEGQAGGSAISYDGSNTSLNVNVKGSLPAISGTVTVGAIVGPAGGSCLKAISPSGDAVRSLLFTKDSAGTYGELSGSGQGIFNLPVYGTVTVGNSVTIGSLPAISGTVTVSNATTASAVAVRLIAEDTNPGGSGAGVNVNLYSNDNALLVDALKNGNSVLGYDGLSSYVQVKPAIGSSVTIGSLPAISGTVTANVLGYSDNEASYQPIPVVPWDENVSSGRAVVVKVQQEGMPLLEISGTVTAAAPNGSLTTRFGTPTTANTAFATSAVTNANRKYLLIQNVTTGSNVITVGIGFTPTTTQGIQLTAGAGITFESSYIPTGAVYVLSGVTASNFTILEA